MSQAIPMDLKPETTHDDISVQKKFEDDGHVAFEAIDPEEERQVVRKLDLHVLPLMIFVYFCMCKFTLLG